MDPYHLSGFAIADRVNQSTLPASQQVEIKRVALNRIYLIFQLVRFTMPF